MQAHFLAVRDDVLLAAPFAHLGAGALVVVAALVARRLAAPASGSAPWPWSSAGPWRCGARRQRTIATDG